MQLPSSFKLKKIQKYDGNKLYNYIITLMVLYIIYVVLY